MDVALEQRFGTYIARKGNKRLAEIARNRRIVQEATETVGAEVLLPQHIRSLAYLLGFTDTTYSSKRHTSCIGDRCYEKEIEPLIPHDACIEIQVTGYQGVVYRVAGVAAAFQDLHQKGRLMYTAERFEIARRRL